MTSTISSAITPNINLYLSLKHGDVEKVKTLIQKGANVNYVYSDTKTPLHLAAEHSPECLQLLINKGACLDRLEDAETLTPKVGLKFSPLHYVIKHHPKYLPILLKAGANIWRGCNNHTTYSGPEHECTTFRPSKYAHQIGNTLAKQMLKKEESAPRFRLVEVLERNQGSRTYIRDAKTNDLYQDEQWIKFCAKTFVVIASAPILMIKTALCNLIKGVIYTVGFYFSYPIIFPHSSKCRLVLNALWILPLATVCIPIYFLGLAILGAPYKAISLVVTALRNLPFKNEGRAALNRIEKSWKEMHILHSIGLSPIGNLGTSKISKASKFRLKQFVPI